jgi:hypothetical protein
MKLSLRKVLLASIATFAFVDMSAQGVGLEWSKHFGGKSYDQGNAIAVDKDRNVYVAGYFNDTTSFNITADLVAKGSSDIFVAKLDWTGNTLWVKQFGGSGSDAAMALKLDTANNIYITGYISDTVDFNPGGTPYELIATTGSDIFVAKLDTAGSVVWAKSMDGATGSDEGRALALDAEGNVHTTGVFYGTVDFDPDPAVTFNLSGTSSEIFISKLDNNGQFVWARKMGGPRLDSGEGIGVDQDGNVYTTGSFQRTADFDPGTNIFNLISGSNTYDVFISKLNIDGDFVWAKQIKGPSPNMGNGLALDSAANIYLTGMFTGTADFDPGANNYDLTALGSTDIYVAKLDSAGTFIWASQMGGTLSSGSRGYSVAVDVWGNTYTTGFFSGTVDFDPDPVATHELTTVGSSDIFVAKLNAAGGFSWAKQLSGPSAIDWGTSITIDPSSNVYTTGLFNGTVDFDPDATAYPLTAHGNTDVFINKLFCTDTTSAEQVVTTGCNGYELAGKTFTTSGTYTVIIPNSKGCDSIITLQLTIEVPEAIITVDEFTLGTTQPYVTYQWIFNGAAISGANSSTYTVSENGNYTVAVTDDYGCIDTSAVYNVSNVTSIASPYVTASQIAVYPNPAQDMLYINSPVAVNLSLAAIDGSVIFEAANSRKLDVSKLAAGLYLLSIKDKEGHLIKTEKVVKH